MSRPSSDDLRALVLGDHKVAVQADVWYAGELVAEALPVRQGTCKYEWGQPVPSSVTLEVADQDGLLIPRREEDPLAPFGQEVNVRRGVVLPDGRKDFVSLGWFRLQKVKATRRWLFRPEQTVPLASGPRRIGALYRSGGASLPVEGVDRMANVADARFLAPEKPVATGSCIEEIYRLCDGLVPIGEVYNVTDRSVPSSITYSDDRLGAVQALAAAMSATVYTDGDGLLTIRAFDADEEPRVLGIGEDGLLVHADFDLDRDGAYNAVVVRGETTGDVAPVQAVATAQQGALRFGGPFGRVPTFYSSPLITTEAQAQAAAVSRLGNVISNRTQVVEVECAPDPTVEPGDRVTIQTPDDDDGGLQGWVVSQDMPLTAAGGGMSLGVEVDTRDLFALTAATL